MARSSTKPAPAPMAPRGVRGAGSNYPTFSGAAAEEFKLRSAANKAVNGARGPSAQGGGPQAAARRSACFSARSDFNFSHQALLGSCWEMRDVESLSTFLARSVMRNVPKTVHKVVLSSSSGLGSLQREGKSSSAFFTSAAASTISLPTFVGGHTSPSTCAGGSSGSSKRGVQKHSHWISLIQLQPRGPKQWDAFSVPNPGGGGVRRYDRAPFGSTPGEEVAAPCKCMGGCGCLPQLFCSRRKKERRGHFLHSHLRYNVDYTCAGQKDKSAFMLKTQTSDDKNNAFLKKHGLWQKLGTRLRRWDRVDVFSPNVQSLLLAAAKAQTESATTLLGPLLGGYSPLLGGDASFAAGGAFLHAKETAEPVLLGEGVPSAPPRNSVESAEPPPRFPENSLYCHCFALPTNYLQELQAAVESVQVTALTPVASTQDMETALGGFAGPTNGAPLQAPSAYHGSDNQGSADCKASTSTVAAHAPAKRFGPALTETDLPQLEVDALEPASAGGQEPQPPPFQADAGNSVTTAPALSLSLQSSLPTTILSSVIVSAFELSIDPTNGRPSDYCRLKVQYSETKAHSRHKFGEGVATSVMYGGVLVVECTSHAAVHELEKALKRQQWRGEKRSLGVWRGRSQMLRGQGNAGGRRSAQRARSSTHSIPVVRGGEDTRCGGCVPSDDPGQLGWYRVVYCMGGERGSSWASDSNVGRQPRAFDTVSEHTGHPALTPWLELKKVVALAASWARRLLSDPKLVEPISVYVQRFSGILLSLDLISDWKDQLQQLITDSEEEKELTPATRDTCATRELDFLREEDPRMASPFAMADYTPSVPSVRNTCRPLAPSLVGGARRSASLSSKIESIHQTLFSETRDSVSKTRPIESQHKQLRAKMHWGVVAGSAEKSNSNQENEVPSEDDDNEALWEMCMMEATALEAELAEVMDASQEAEDELSALGGNIHTLKRAFLPSTEMHRLEVLCTYLETAIYEPEEVPEQYACIEGPDWFPCLAAVLTNPRNSLRGINILSPVEYAALPQLGMLAGLFFHECAMKSLSKLRLRCDVFEYFDYLHPELHKTKSWNPLRQWWEALCGVPSREECARVCELVSLLQCRECRSSRCPPFILTRRQLREVLFTLLGSVVENNQQPHFTLQLTDRGNYRSLRQTWKKHGLFSGLRNIMKCCTVADEINARYRFELHRTKDWIRNNNSLPPQKRDCFWTSMPSFGAMGGNPEAIERALAEAERRPYCLLLRHKHPASSSSESFSFWREDSACERCDSGRASASDWRWTYGLESVGTQRIVTTEFEFDACYHAHFIAGEMHNFVDRCNTQKSSGMSSKGGEVVAKKLVTLLI
ncbi:uncharacterized protein Tco025E_00282 [Trypanosoma conorhini]|uniref:Uncharacterized protein n=1 Tax=Trypanosoma conorhini TaxID=83891 RepID=A0A422QBX4_9TRYP|nr:uncharacterized protein Tco025E_00282 [Trypanosoma conorhini]RNF27480.1 hypothetical protein Tco025E_00282 [Trypanosoma conorhini]